MRYFLQIVYYFALKAISCTEFMIALCIPGAEKAEHPQSGKRKE